MGRAIDQDNILEDHERRLKLIEGALEEMIQTKVHHIDLHDELDKHEESIRAEGVEVTPDETFEKPSKKSKTKKVEKKEKVRVVEQLL